MEFKKYWRKTSLKNKLDGNFLLKHIEEIKPKNFLEVGVFHGVTSRNVCEMLYLIHGHNFKFTGIDLFLGKLAPKREHVPIMTFSNPLKNIYYNHIIKLDPYSLESVLKLLKKFKGNVNIIKGDSQNKKHSKLVKENEESKKPKKTVKSLRKTKKIRKK